MSELEKTFIFRRNKKKIILFKDNELNFVGVHIKDGIKNIILKFSIDEIDTQSKEIENFLEYLKEERLFIEVLNEQ